MRLKIEDFRLKIGKRQMQKTGEYNDDK